LGNLSTPKSVQKLQMALHAKAKAEAGYRFYALYDKISREDILAHAYAQCRSNKGAPGVDGQDFADIEAYGVQRWLGELALALRQETYRPDPIRRVFIPKANGKPLGISTLRDRISAASRLPPCAGHDPGARARLDHLIKAEEAALFYRRACYPHFVLLERNYFFVFCRDVGRGSPASRRRLPSHGPPHQPGRSRPHSRVPASTGQRSCPEVDRAPLSPGCGGAGASLGEL
jgi:hypothetical protein